MTVDTQATLPVRRREAMNAAPVETARPLFTILGQDGLRIMDQVVLAAWFAAMLYPTPFRPIVLYSCCLYFLASIFLHWGAFRSVLIRCWPLYIVGTLAFVSSLWAPSASEAIRKSLLFFLSAIVAMFFATRLTARQILYTIFVVYFFAGVASAIRPNYYGDAAVGIFNQKNVLAVSMFALYGPSLLLLLDRRAPKILRAAAIIGAPMAFYLILISQSATVLLVTLFATLGLLVHQLLWRPAAGVAHARTILTFVAAILVIVVVFVVFGLIEADIFALVLEAFGKDTTLTGRTVLWETAERVMAEHPWTGLGAQGFWRPESGSAATLLRFLHYDSFVPFNFHNSFYENGVSYGYPGFYGTLFLAAWCIFQALRNWLKFQTMFNFYFFLITVVGAIRSYSETDFAVEFGATMVFIAAARFGIPQPEASEIERKPPPPPQTRPQRVYRRQYAAKPVSPDAP